MKKLLALCVILAVTVCFGGWFGQHPGLNIAGGSGTRLTCGMTYNGYEGGYPTMYANSKLPFAHKTQIQYKYKPSTYATHVGQTAVNTFTPVTYFAAHADAENAFSKLFTGKGLYDGDSLYVRVVDATVADSVTIDVEEVGYLISHTTATLAMGNPYSSTLFNPTGLTPTRTVTCTADNFLEGWVRRDGAFADTCTYAYASTPVRMNTSPTQYSPATAQQYGLFWWELDSIPDNVTIVEAKLCLDLAYANDVVLASADDGLYATLDTLSHDMPWITDTLVACNPIDPLGANVHWAKMSRIGGGAWVPTLESRTGPHFWGIRSPIAHTRQGAATVDTLTTGHDVLIDVKEILQYWVDYHDIRDIKNAGFWIGGSRAAGEVSVNLTTGTDGSSEARIPSLIVRYQTKSHAGQYDWNGYPFVFVFTTDDEHTSNLGYKTQFDSRGLKYTMFTTGEYLGANNRLTSAQVRSFHDAGYEVGNHGALHTDSSESDSATVKANANRGWLASILGLSGQDTMQIKSFAYTYGDTSVTAGGFSIPWQLNRWDYSGARIAGNITVTSATPLLWDTASQPFKVDKWNWNLLADNNDTGVGAADSIRAKLRRVYGFSTYRGGVDGGEPIITLSHGTSKAISYGGGVGEMDSIPLGSLLDEITRRGDTWICTFGELMDYYRAHHTSVGGNVWTLP